MMIVHHISTRQEIVICLTVEQFKPSEGELEQDGAASVSSGLDYEASSTHPGNPFFIWLPTIAIHDHVHIKGEVFAAYDQSQTLTSLLAAARHVSQTKSKLDKYVRNI